MRASIESSLTATVVGAVPVFAWISSKTRAGSSNVAFVVTGAETLANRPGPRLWLFADSPHFA
jgi:hypothetical protein